MTPVTLNYRTEEGIYDEIDKLLRHMDKHCPILNVYESINRYIPDYLKYKESDLVLGDEKILISTVHKAKGLEFPNVVIPDCTDDVYPAYWEKKSGSAAIKESARILYVAMTRAKKRLLITSHTTNFTPYGKRVYQEPSRFLEPVMGYLER